MMKKALFFVFVSFFLLSCEKNIPKVGNSLKLVGKPVSISRARMEQGGITCSMDGGTMDDVMKMLPNDISICISENLRFSRICVDVVDLDVETFLLAVSESIGCRISRYGSLFVFNGAKAEQSAKTLNATGGASDNLDSYLFYFRLPYYRKEEVQQVLGAGVIFVSGDSYIYKGGLQNVVKVKEMIDNMILTIPCEYAFEIFFVSREKLFNFGVTGDLSVDLQSLIKKGTGSLSVNEWSIVSQALASFQLKRTLSDSCRHICGVFRENSKYESNVGDSVPFIKRVIQENGSSYNSDIQYIEVGTKLSIGCSGEAVGVVDLNLEVNETTGYVETYPQKRGSNIRTQFYVGGDERRFVGSFFVSSSSRSVFGSTDRKSEWLVFCRVLRVSVGQRADFSS